jgi:putative drug exporter of the RND superfamily
MFSLLAKFVSKYAILITLFWVALAVAFFLMAPTLREVGVTEESQFLPQNTESTYARELLKEKFPATAEASKSTGILVMYNEQGLTEQDMQEAKAIHDWLLSDAAPKVVTQVVSIFDGEELRSALVSSDQTTMLMTIGLSVNSADEPAKQAIGQIREYIHAEYPDARIYITGDAGIFKDLFSSVEQTINRTTLVTIILVIALLLIVYRSPIASLVPMITIGCSFLVARGAVGYMAQAGVNISTLADAYLVVMIFGVGTDYCLFIVSRFREELARNDREKAQGYTLRNVGPVILASATTVIVAFLCLTISRFGMTRTMGLVLAVGVAITLVAGLTLMPALMSLFGRHLFWPVKVAREQRQGGFGWMSIGRLIARHPAAVALPIIALLLLPYIALSHYTLSVDMLSQMSKGVESAKGFQVLRQHFPVGELTPLYLLIESREDGIVDARSLEAISQIAPSLEQIDGVSRVEYYAGPSPRLSDFSTQMSAIADELSQGAGLDTDKIAVIQAVSEYMPELASRYSGVLQSQNFGQATADLTEISAIINQINNGQPEDLPGLLAQLQGLTLRLSASLGALGNEFTPIGESPLNQWLLATYFSADKTTARINVVLKSDPYSNEALKAVAPLREAVNTSISASSLKGSSHYIGGESAVNADIMRTNNADFGRVFGITIASVLLVIMVLLRSLLAPLYMVATVLLNYGATLGISTWLFIDVLNHNAMIYMVPMFVFVVLVATGADYNIFLVSRIREEAEKRPIREAVLHAVANTGAVITAAGIILAGTFATLTSAPLQVVLQVGAAIAIGVLIDTFIVRALLVPSIAAIAGRWSWWPRHLSGQ